MCVSRILRKRINEVFDENCIIQPGRVIPTGQYVRRRACTKQHKSVWEEAIKKYKHVKCMFQNCHFLALSVEDMITHFGYCNGDGSFAKFICPYCEGRVTSEKFLEIHIRKSHMYDCNPLLGNHFLCNDEDAIGPSETDNKDPSKQINLRTNEEAEEGRIKIERFECELQDNILLPELLKVESEILEDEAHLLHKNGPKSVVLSGITDHCDKDDDKDDNCAYEDETRESVVTNEQNDKPVHTSKNVKSNREKDSKNDHIYSKRNAIGGSDSSNSLLVMKNSNVKHYSGYRNITEKTKCQKMDEMYVKREIEEGSDEDDSSRIEKEITLASSLEGEIGGNSARQIINLPFPSVQKPTKRKVEQSYNILWKDSIKFNGFARCLVATCNFISLDIFHIQNHFKTCNGEPASGPNLCNLCNSRLPSAIELSLHSQKCKAYHGFNLPSENAYEDEKDLGLDIPMNPDDKADNEGQVSLEDSAVPYEVPEVTYSDSDSHKDGSFDLSTEPCRKKKKVPSLRISDIIKLKGKEKSENASCIVQAGPVLPKGEYMRRRAYTKQHKAVWEAALEKHKYVKCVFQNCHFVAMSLEDMIYHFGYCIGDGSFAKYECPHCGGRLTTKMVLDIHIRLSHSENITNDCIDDTLEDEEGEFQNDEILSSLEQLKKILNPKEIKTYRKRSTRARTERLENSDVTLEDQACESRRNNEEIYNNISAEVVNQTPVNNTVSGSFGDAIENEFDSLLEITSQPHLSDDMSKDKTDEVGYSIRNNELKGNNVSEQSVYPLAVTITNPHVDNVNQYEDNNIDCESCKEQFQIVQSKSPIDFEGSSLCDSECTENINNKTNCNNDVPNIALSSTAESGNKLIEQEETINDTGKSAISDKESEKKVSQSNRDQRRGSGETSKSKEQSDTPSEDNSLGKKGMQIREHKGREPDSRKRNKRKVSEGEGGEGNPTESRSKRTKLEPPPENQDNALSTRRRSRNSGNPNEEPVKKEFITEPIPEKTGRRGRKRKAEKDKIENEIQGSSNKILPDQEEVKCAKCNFRTRRRQFSDHNFRKHVGLSWIEGENPIDLNDESVISWNIKQAFKFIKSATCEKCNCVKKSALGFISHIQNCGKSKEEQEALKVTCPHCPARILKYSLPVHLKLSHSDPAEEVRKSVVELEGDTEISSKRRSAIRAANKFLEVLKHCEDEEELKSKSHYVFYEKGISKFPKLPHKIRLLWKKMIKEKKKIPCRRGSCLAESSSIDEARCHHFLCSELPSVSYICQLCDYYSVTESDVEQHVNIHAEPDGDFTVGSDEEKQEEEIDIKDVDLNVSPEPTRNKLKASETTTEDALETSFKGKFFVRENLVNDRKALFCGRSLRMTFDFELEEAMEKSLRLPELRTNLSDWNAALVSDAESHLPGLKESMSFSLKLNKKTSGPTWRKIKRFEGVLFEDAPLIFTGGSVLSMSWCKYSCVTSCKESPRQYLAISSSRDMNKFQNIHAMPDNQSGFIQIWDCGEMNSAAGEIPKMVIGIVHDSGETWDLSWCPIDTKNEGTSEDAPRIGLLGAACQDGTVKIWSVCDPQRLNRDNRLPFYNVEPNIIMKLEERIDVGCMRLAIGRTGVIVGGYANGMIAVWNMNGISSPFCKKVGKSFLLKPCLSFQAHRTSITALSLCPRSDRYIATSGLDRFIKFWDLECVNSPFESILKEVCLENVWSKNWPLTVSVLEDIVPCSGKCMIKAIRDSYCDKHRAPLALESTCWSVSLNDWMNVLCGCNIMGEVKIRYLRNMFLTDEKFRFKAGNVFSTTELMLLVDARKGKNCNKAADGKITSQKNSKWNGTVPRTYEEASAYFGLIFHEYGMNEDIKPKNFSNKGSVKENQSIETYPITSVNKVLWNPNYGSLKYLAMGHQSGFVRIRPLDDPQCCEQLSKFYEETRDIISKL